jgi:hypothetical protein
MAPTKKKAQLSFLKTVSASTRGNTDLRNSATCILADNIVQHELADYKIMIRKTEGLCAHP